MRFRLYRTKRVMEMYGDSAQDAVKNIHKSDNARAAYYQNISGQVWGDSCNYDLSLSCIDGMEKTADFICQYVQAKQKG